MSAEDVRWIQRYHHYIKALAQMTDAVELSKKRPLTRLEEQGLIQAFEFTHELAWNTLKDFLEGRGVQNLFGSRDTSRAAFKSGLIRNGDVWMEMIASRNLTTHSYDESTVVRIVSDISNSYILEFSSLRDKLEEEKQKGSE